MLEHLRWIEKEHKVKIIYACEAGSRATGLATQKSDYDIRFIYVRPVEAYLTIEKTWDDTISVLMTDKLDLHGWDLQKALFLLSKSNPSLFEWFQSEIVYIDHKEITKKMKGVPFSKKASFYHYFNMAKGNYTTLKKSGNVSIKLYINVVRPLLACLWLEKEETFPPIQYDHLLKYSECDELHSLARLKKGETVALNYPYLNTYIEKQLKRLDLSIKTYPDKKTTCNEDLNDIFLFSLMTCWNQPLNKGAWRCPC